MGVSESCAQYKKWYYELLVEKVDKDENSCTPHLRVGWANTAGYSPYPVGGDFYGENGVGDDSYSFGFDGLNLWTGMICVVISCPEIVLCLYTCSWFCFCKIIAIFKPFFILLITDNKSYKKNLQQNAN